MGKNSQLIDPTHDCTLPQERAGFARLPPNAPFIQKLFRWFRELNSLNPNLGISVRNFRNRSQMNAEASRHANSKFFYIIHPFSSMALYRELIFFLIATWHIISAPLIGSLHWAEWKGIIKFDHNITDKLAFITLAILLMWTISCFFSGYKESSGKMRIQLNNWKITKRYLMSYFIIDVIALIVPMEWDDESKIFFWLNLIISMRSVTIIQITRRLLLDLKFPDEIITCIHLLMASFFFMHCFTCLFIIIPIMFYDPSEETLWITESKLQNTNAGIIYFGVFSMVQSHFWGLGEASETVENYREKLVLILVMITGRIWSLYVIAVMLRVFTITSLSESRYDEYLLQLKTFISSNDMPKEMEERLMEFYKYKYQRQFFNENAIFSTMSKFLLDELRLFQAKSVINKVHLFKSFPKSMIADIISKCKILVFMNNDFIIKAGDPMLQVSFVSSGTVAVLDNDMMEMVHLTDGDEIGIRAVQHFGSKVFDNFYVAIETTEIYAITVKELREIVYSNHDVLNFFQKKVQERAQLWQRIQMVLKSQGSIFSEVIGSKSLETPRVRTRYFER